MPWRALLRLVNFPSVFTHWAAADLSGGGREADEETGYEWRATEVGRKAIIRVLSTGRATIPDVHDLAWYDHVTGSNENGTAWEGDANRKFLETLRVTAMPNSPMRRLFPHLGESDWIDIGLILSGKGRVRLERGAYGPYSVGLVTLPEVPHLLRYITFYSTGIYSQNIGHNLLQAGAKPILERVTAIRKPGLFVAFVASSEPQ